MFVEYEVWERFLIVGRIIIHRLVGAERAGVILYSVHRPAAYIAHAKYRVSIAIRTVITFSPP